MRTTGDEKTLNIGFLRFGKKKHLQQRQQHFQDEQKSCNLQQQAAEAVSSTKHQAPRGRSAVCPALLDTRCAGNAATTRISPSFFFVAREGSVAAKIGSVAAGVRALAAAAPPAAAPPAALARSGFLACGSACLKWLLLLTTALARSSACVPQCLLAAALAYRSACLPQRFQQHQQYTACSSSSP